MLYRPCFVPECALKYGSKTQYDVSDTDLSTRQGQPYIIAISGLAIVMAPCCVLQRSGKAEKKGQRSKLAMANSKKRDIPYQVKFMAQIPVKVVQNVFY